jgi:hypothetical protein
MSENIKQKMVIDCPSDTSFELTPGYGRETKENEKLNSFAPLRESRWSNQ